MIKLEFLNYINTHTVFRAFEQDDCHKEENPKSL